MKLTFSSSHLSITSFPDIEVPDFVLITGHNGAGKSHFLQALMQGQIRADCAPNQSTNNQTEIRLFDWSTLVPQDTGYFSSDNIRNEKANIYSNFNTFKTAHNAIEPLRTIARSNDFLRDFIADPTPLTTFSVTDLNAMCGDVGQATILYQQIKEAADESFNSIFNQWSDVSAKNSLISIAASKNIHPIFLEERDIISSHVPNWGQVNVFQQSFARLFVSYRDMYLANQLAQYRASKGHEDANAISDEEFEIRHGPPPWDFVNQSLIEANLDFQINKPDLTDYTHYLPQLKKKHSGVVIPFSSLSSGEKVLMSFAFCVYYASDRRQLSIYPKIILLDEVDAPLHPSMSKSLINTIVHTMVGSFGIKVIATTHSPSTVALSPEIALYLMRAGHPGLHKTTTSEALNVLTVGVPTLAISYDGRRQVFVESPADAQTYDAMYRILKPRLKSERSLEFVATGTRSSSGQEANTGCDVVKRLVNDLASAGNSSVYGLLDWDGHHTPSERIVVLAHNKRNGLENVLFDPLLIASLICRDCPSHKSIIGIPENVGFIKLSQYNLEDVQPIVSRVAELVLGSPASKAVVSEYINGFKIEVDERYFTTDDHTLEEMIISAFPFLKSVTKQQAGKLMQHIIGNVLSDFVDFAPIEILDVFNELLQRDTHVS